MRCPTIYNTRGRSARPMHILPSFISGSSYTITLCIFTTYNPNSVLAVFFTVVTGVLFVATGLLVMIISGLYPVPVIDILAGGFPRLSTPVEYAAIVTVTALLISTILAILKLTVNAENEGGVYGHSKGVL